MKKVISINYCSSTPIWKPWRWVRLNLVLSMRDIYINSNLNPLKKFTSSSRSTDFKDILPRSIFQMITKTNRINTRIVISYEMKPGILLWIWWKVNGNWEKNMISISQWKKAISEQTLEIKKSKRAALWESQSGIQEGKLTIWVRSFEKYSRVLQVYQFHQNR